MGDLPFSSALMMPLNLRHEVSNFISNEYWQQLFISKALKSCALSMGTFTHCSKFLN